MNETLRLNCDKYQWNGYIISSYSDPNACLCYSTGIIRKESFSVCFCGLYTDCWEEDSCLYTAFSHISRILLVTNI